LGCAQSPSTIHEKTGEKSHKKRGKESEVMMKLNAWHAERRHQQAPQYLVYPINEKKTKLTRRAHIPLILRHYRTGPWRRDLPPLPTTGRLQIRPQYYPAPMELFLFFLLLSFSIRFDTRVIN
jgi:hypothetical protein